MVEIFKVEISRSQLDSVEADDRELFILSGHFANDTNILNKQLLFSMGDPREDDAVLIRYKMALQMMNLRLLIGRLCAGWEILSQQKYRDTLERASIRLQTDPELIEFDTDLSRALSVLDDELGSGSLLMKVRNKTAAHTDRKALMDAYAALPSDHVFWDLLTRSRGNSLYGTGDELSALALLALTGESDPQTAIGKVMDAALRASEAFGDLVQGWFLCFMWTHFRDLAESIGSSALSFEAQEMSGLRLHYLTNEPKITC